MKCKRMAALLLTVACALLWMMPVTAAPSATITIGTVTAAPGDTVVVPLSVSQVDGLGAVGIHLKYDTAVLECVAAEATGIMNNMDTNTANKAPVNRTGEVWLTGMCLKGVSGSGDLMKVTFKVKDDAPEGLSTIGFVDDRPNQLILLDGSLMTATNVSGGVAVTTAAQQPTPTDPPVTTTVTTTAPDSAAPTNVPTTTAAPITRPGGETVTVSEVTVVDANGTVVTTPQGEPLQMQNIAVMVDVVRAMPGDRVTVDVAVTEVTELTILGIDVSYDAQALTFVSGETLGFLNAEMNAANVTCNEDGVVVIAGTDPVGVNGEGVIARLTFDVKRTVKAGQYPLALNPAPVFMSKATVEVPAVTYAGSVTVEADGTSNTWIFAVVGAVVAAGALATILVVASRRKKAAAE